MTELSENEIFVYQKRYRSFFGMLKIWQPWKYYAEVYGGKCQFWGFLTARKLAKRVANLGYLLELSKKVNLEFVTDKSPKFNRIRFDNNQYEQIKGVNERQLSCFHRNFEKFITRTEKLQEDVRMCSLPNFSDLTS